MKKPREEQNAEYERFNQTMDQLLKVPPEIVKSAMEDEKRKREEQRKAKRASADHASTGKD